MRGSRIGDTDAKRIRPFRKLSTCIPVSTIAVGEVPDVCGNGDESESPLGVYGFALPLPEFVFRFGGLRVRDVSDASCWGR